jgi:hypothetical protein
MSSLENVDAASLASPMRLRRVAGTRVNRDWMWRERLVSARGQPGVAVLVARAAGAWGRRDIEIAAGDAPRMTRAGVAIGMARAFHDAMASWRPELGAMTRLVYDNG